jgi:CRISPR/Cas system-associated exonuclease Cas4 (RecB family)
MGAISWAQLQYILYFTISSWAVWVTKSVYDMNKEQAIVKVQYQDLKEDLKEIKSILYDMTSDAIKIARRNIHKESSSSALQEVDK